MAVLQELADLSGPRRALLLSAALLPVAATLPWYRFEGDGFVLQLSGWHDLGVVAWILAVDLVVWELLRIAGVVRIDRDRGDRWSAAVGGLVALVGGVFALQRVVDGALGWGWIPGTVLIGGLAWAAARTFLDAGGPATIGLAAGSEVVDDRRPASAASGARAEIPPWRAGAPGSAPRPASASRRDVARPPTSAADDRPRSESARPRAPVDGRPDRRPRPSPSGGPPAGGWPKTPAERQRDAPSLWSRAGDEDRRRPGRSS